MSPRLVQKTLTAAGLGGYVAVCNPMLRKRNKHKRLIWAQTHKAWTPVQWIKVMFTDEKKFEFFGTVWGNMCDAEEERGTEPTVKSGGGGGADDLYRFGTLSHSAESGICNLSSPKYHRYSSTTLFPMERPLLVTTYW